MSQFGNGNDVASEMVIVNRLTQLIFNASARMDETDHQLVQLLAHIEPSLMDASNKDLTDYLLALNISEMISIVAEVKALFDQHRVMPLSTHYLQQSVFKL